MYLVLVFAETEIKHKSYFWMLNDKVELQRVCGCVCVCVSEALFGATPFAHKRPEGRRFLRIFARSALKEIPKCQRKEKRINYAFQHNKK